MKKRAFVGYTKKGKIIPGSLIETSGNYPYGPSLWYEVDTNLCCNTTTSTTTSTTTTSTTTTTTTVAPEFVTFNVTASGGNVVNFSADSYQLTGSINWGDGNVQTFTNTYDPAYSHTYAAGNYVATIYINNPQNLKPANVNYGFRLSGTAITAVNLSMAPTFPIITINGTSVTTINTSVNTNLNKLTLFDNPITSFSNIILPTSPITPVQLRIANLQINTISLTSANTNIKTLAIGDAAVTGKNAGPLTSVSIVGTPSNFTGLYIYNAASLTSVTINAPNLKNLDLRTCNILSSSGLVTTDISGLNSYSLSTIPLITTFTIDGSQIPLVTYLGLNQLTNLTSVQATNLSLLKILYLSNMTSLTTIDLTGSTSNIEQLYGFNSSYSQTIINNLLIALDANGKTGPNPYCVVFLNGGTNAVPSGAGITAKNNLIAKSWDVYTN